MLPRLLFGGGALLALGLAQPAQAQIAALAATAENGGTSQAAPPAPASAAAAPAAPTIFLTAEEMPAFPGGNEAMLKFIGSHVRWPDAALDQAVSGKVYVTFVVDTEGRPRDPHVVKGLGYGLDEEALRLVRLMPWWNPGKNQGQPVWVQLTLPIGFRSL